MIKLYTLPNCKYCDQARKFLKRKRVEFEELTLFKEEQNRLAVFEKTGQMAVPVIEISGELVIGFDEEKIKELLKKNK